MAPCTASRPERLAAEAPRWESRFAHIPHPRVAVLLGGPNARYSLGSEEIGQLAEQLKALAAQGWGLLVTGSRRTGAANIEALRKALEGLPAFISDGGGDNPYFGMLAHADAFIVTCDSVNMVTEACSTGKPVHVLMLPTPGGAAEAAATSSTASMKAFKKAGARACSTAASKHGPMSRCARWNASRALSGKPIWRAELLKRRFSLTVRGFTPPIEAKHGHGVAT